MDQERQRDRSADAAVTPRRNEWRGDLVMVLVIVVVWLVMAILVNPRGDFPLNDDWAYGRAVKTLLEQGRPEIVDIVTMTLIAQVYWGALFCLPFAFSFTALRISTLTLGLVGVVALYLILREVGAGRRISLIGALMLAANPIFFALSNTFMTDVPFISVVMLSLYAWTRGLRHESPVALVLGVLLACVAVLIRQTGLVLPVALGLAYVVNRGLRPKTVVIALLPLAAAAVSYMGYEQWLDATQGIPQFYTDQNQWMLQAISKGFAGVFAGLDSVILAGVAYLGWFLLPVVVVAFASRLPWGRPDERKRTLALAGGLLLVVLAGLMHEGRLMPLKGEPTGDIFTRMGIGPFTVWDVFVLRQESLARIPSVIPWLITLASVLGGAALLYELGASLKPLFGRTEGAYGFDKSIMALLLTVALVTLAPVVLMHSHAYFDRYFLPPVPLLGVYLILSVRRPHLGRAVTAIALILVVLSGLLSVALTHDYLAWNRARWAALDQLVEEDGVAPSDIDGGLEFNAWNNYDPLNWNAWFLVNDEYRVAFDGIEGYDVVAEYPFSRWLPRGQAQILVLRKALY